MAAFLLLAIAATVVSCFGGASRSVTVWLLALVLLLFVLLGRSTSGGVTLQRLADFPDEHVTLRTPQSRAEFNELERLGRRIDDNAGALQQVVPRAEADETLVRALWEGARLVASQQNTRQVVHDLKSQDGTQLSPDAAAADLAAERDRATAQLKDIGTQIDHLRTRLAAVANAGDEFVREQRAREATRQPQQTPANAGTSTTNDRPGTPDELVHQTLAIMQAYEELRDAHVSAS
ncbi:hypothetical protein [Micromonospora sp. IBSANI012]|uniref:hypothetical protein n=1 Tax=Micromonospora sp. IBSANI012 TaxID=3457761 RepID=UPI004058F916